MLKGYKKSWQNQQATVIVIRDGKEMHLPVQVGEYSAQKADNACVAAPVHVAREKWGLMLLDLNPKIASQLRLQYDHGLIVVAVQPGSRAEATGLRQGDVIVALRSASHCHC
jgi:S1-C subfamily serine protease